ncbi:hypothetical protein E2C01_031355 [Portunus trituberculatus]|uniref:Uncharacterized protein n=1 Tax=Portunus trituberculatus TaxID=210409 RepID=A0A5B7ESP3_PORTR|nr:hypothetical protein [Portunus trituberculatus]
MARVASHRAMCSKEGTWDNAASSKWPRKNGMVTLIRTVEWLVWMSVGMSGKPDQLPYTVVYYIKNKSFQRCSRFFMEN